MNPKQLQTTDGELLEAYRCGECGLIYSEREPYSSDRCCVCKRCGKSTHKKGGTRAYVCDDCWGPYHRQLDAERLERATELPDYTGPVVCGDDYYESVDALLDDKDDDELPEYVHTCTVHHYRADPDNILSNILEPGCPDHDCDCLTGVKELEAAIAAFNAANSGPDATTYWEIDTKHKVRVPKAENER